MPALDEPPTSADLPALLLDYIDFHREQVIATVTAMSEQDATRTRVPSGWTPAQMLNHLAFMERRWFAWGFLGEHVDDPRGDRDGDGFRTPVASVAELAEALRAQGRTTRRIVEGHRLDEVSSPDGLFADPLFSDQPPAHLQWILLHVLQEYAQHAGHLDIVRELGDATR